VIVGSALFKEGASTVERAAVADMWASIA
jgi:hypothetical protein